MAFRAEDWIFKGLGNLLRWARKKDSWREREKAGMRTHAGLIAVSFHRLFLGGLLPSRARFRFAG
jgi:hypothetical protein